MAPLLRTDVYPFIHSPALRPNHGFIYLGSTLFFPTHHTPDPKYNISHLIEVSLSAVAVTHGQPWSGRKCSSFWHSVVSQCLCHSSHLVTSRRSFIVSHHQEKGEYSTARYSESERDHILITFITVYNWPLSNVEVRARTPLPHALENPPFNFDSPQT